MSSSPTPAVMLAVRIDQLGVRVPSGLWRCVAGLVLYGQVFGAVRHCGFPSG